MCTGTQDNGILIPRQSQSHRAGRCAAPIQHAAIWAAVLGAQGGLASGSPATKLHGCYTGTSTKAQMLEDRKRGLIPSGAGEPGHAQEGTTDPSCLGTSSLSLTHRQLRMPEMCLSGQAQPPKMEPCTEAAQKLGQGATVTGVHMYFICSGHLVSA
ncbi:hypothetical protein WJX73_008291 [Symbiochloris irregularis]|uniref:Uncharacterized protein n=1 Tax=Symbiochloris irregularis TaxID=706552 RepID=A0AAW1PHP7_9CHLO